MNTQTPAKPPIGLASILGVLVTIVGAVGAVVAALAGNDTATVAAAAAGLAAQVTTAGGRYAQAVALARRFAPQVEALAHGIAQSPAPVVVNTPPPADPSALIAAVLGGLAKFSPSDPSAKILDGAAKALADDALDEPDGEHVESEPELTEEDLAGRHASSEPVGHGDADLRDEEDGPSDVAELDAQPDIPAGLLDPPAPRPVADAPQA